MPNISFMTPTNAPFIYSNTVLYQLPHVSAPFMPSSRELQMDLKLTKLEQTTTVIHVTLQ
jgi:hypothetical protein